MVVFYTNAKGLFRPFGMPFYKTAKFFQKIHSSYSFFFKNMVYYLENTARESFIHIHLRLQRS